MPQQQAATEAELVEALTRRLRGLPPPTSQAFTVHDVSIFGSQLQPPHPSSLYDKYGGGGGGGGCVYFFCNTFTYQDVWKVAAGTQPVLDGGGVVVGRKDTLVFHEGRWLPMTRWAMDEFWIDDQHWFHYPRDCLRLYRLRRLDDHHP